MDPIITSSLISAGSSLLGGLFGKKKSKTPSFADQLSMNSQMIDNTMGATMAAAAKHGVHPLYALGAPLSPAINFTAGGDDEDRRRPLVDTAADLGQNIARAVHARGTSEEREFAKITAAQALERGQLENELLKSQIAQIRTNGPGNATSSPDPRYPGQKAMPLGFGDTAPFLRTGKDSKGNLIRVYNDDLGDNELLQAATAVGYSMPDWIHGNITKPSAKFLRRVMRRVLAAPPNNYSSFRK